MTLILCVALCFVMLLLVAQVGVLLIHLLLLHGKAALRAAVNSAVLLTVGTVLATVLGLTGNPAELVAA